MTSTYTCPWHEVEIERGQHCTACVERYASLPDPKTMTVEQRVAELNDWYDKAILTISMGDLQQRIEALVGRPVWTHELVNREAFVREMRSGQAASFEDVLDKIPSDKRVVVVVED